MSYVSNVILWCSIEESDDDGFFPGFAPRQLGVINAWLKANRQPSGLADLANAMGGHKAPEVILYGGAFNYLDLPAFLAFLSSLQWTHRDRVRVIMQDQEDDAPQMWMLDKPAGMLIHTLKSPPR